MARRRLHDLDDALRHVEDSVNEALEGLDKTLDVAFSGMDTIIEDMDNLMDDTFDEQPKRKKKKGKGKGKKAQEGKEPKEKTKAKRKAKKKLEAGCPPLPHPPPIQILTGGGRAVRCHHCHGWGTIGWRGLPRYDWLIYTVVFLGLEDKALSRGYFRQTCPVCEGKRKLTVRRPPPPQGSHRM